MSVIRGNLVGTTMSPDSIAERIGGGGGDSSNTPTIITDFGTYTTLANFIKNGMEDNSAVICYTKTRLTDFPVQPDTISESASEWCIEIYKTSKWVTEIKARLTHRMQAAEIPSCRWNSICKANDGEIAWTQVQLYTGEGESGGGGSQDSVLYTEQTLTPEQQAQARENIGAATVDEVIAALPIYDGEVV